MYMYIVYASPYCGTAQLHVHVPETIPVGGRRSLFLTVSGTAAAESPPLSCETVSATCTHIRIYNQTAPTPTHTCTMYMYMYI